ncbi:MAG: hypothetical protein ABSC06_28680 [Rhodopila sp.]
MANDAWLEGGMAVAALRWAEIAGHSGIQSLEVRADALMARAARLLVTAYEHYQEVRGVSRAVGLARRGVAWTPRRTHEDMEWLLRFEATG